MHYVQRTLWHCRTGVLCLSLLPWGNLCGNLPIPPACVRQGWHCFHPNKFFRLLVLYLLLMKHDALTKSNAAVIFLVETLKPPWQVGTIWGLPVSCLWSIDCPGWVGGSLTFLAPMTMWSINLHCPLSRNAAVKGTRAGYVPCQCQGKISGA